MKGASWDGKESISEKTGRVHENGEPGYGEYSKKGGGRDGMGV